MGRHPIRKRFVETEEDKEKRRVRQEAYLGLYNKIVPIKRKWHYRKWDEEKEEWVNCLIPTIEEETND